MSDLWTEATYDAEAETLDRHVTAAKVAVADSLPFLMAAADEIDFANRKAMIAPRLDTVVSAVLSNRSVVEVGEDPSLFGVVRATLEARIDEDFATLASVRQHEALQQALAQKKAAEIEQAFAERLTAAVAARKQAEAESTCSVCGDKIAKDPSSEDPSTYHHDNGEKHDHEAKPGGGGDSAREAAYRQADEACRRPAEASLQTQAEFPPKKDEEKPPATGTEVEHKPEEQKSSGVERKVELDPTSGQYVGSEWEDSGDGVNLVQSASTFGNNPRFATEEEANGWVAEGGKEEDTTKPDEEPHEQPKNDDPFPDKEGKQSVPFGREAAAGLACGNCGSSDVTLTIAPGASGSGPGGGWRMGDSGGIDVLDCRACGARIPAFPKQAAAGDNPTERTCTNQRCLNYGEHVEDDHEHYVLGKDAAAGDTCPTCHGSGQVAAAEGSTNEGYDPCPDCQGTGKTASVTAADTRATPAEGTVKAVGNGSLAERATCANCGKSITKGVAQRTSGWVHQSGSKWCPSGATAGLQAEANDLTNWVDTAKQVVLNHQFQNFGPDSMLLDATTATMLLTVYNALSPENQQRFAEMPLHQAVDIGWKLSAPKTASTTAGWFDRKPKDTSTPSDSGSGGFSNPEQQRLWDAAQSAHDADAMDYLSDSDPGQDTLDYYTKKYPKTAAKSDVCPKCGAHMDDVVVNGDTMTAKCDDCGWSGSKTKKTAADISQQMYEWGYRKGEADKAAGTIKETWNSDTPGMEEVDMRTSEASFPTGYRDAVEGKPMRSDWKTSSLEGGAPFVGEAEPKVGFSHDVREQLRNVDNGTYSGDSSANPYANSRSKGDPGRATDEQVAQFREEDRLRHEEWDRTMPGWRDGPASRTPKDTSATATLDQTVAEVTARLIAEAEANPYSTPGSPYIPPQVPPGTPDDVLDGPVNPQPLMLETPMTTRPRQMPSGDNSLPDADLEDPAQPKETP